MNYKPSPDTVFVQTVQDLQNPPAKSPWVERIYDDIELHARMRSINEACVEYEVRPLMFWDDGEGSPLKFEARGDGAVGPTHDIDKAEVLITGSIRFDGCSHNYFQDYIHGCGRDELVRLGALYTLLFDWAIEFMPENEEFLK